MSEKDVYHMFLLQIAELIMDCQQMTQEDYNSWKQETLESIPSEDIKVLEKVFMLTDRYSGRMSA